MLFTKIAGVSMSYRDLFWNILSKQKKNKKKTTKHWYLEQFGALLLCEPQAKGGLLSNKNSIVLTVSNSICGIWPSNVNSGIGRNWMQNDNNHGFDVNGRIISDITAAS